MKFKFMILLILIFASILTACSAANNIGIKSTIDWVDFVILNDIHYTRNYQDNYKLSDDSIDGLFGKVKFNVSENIDQPNYKFKNGDSAFLPKGTKLYKMKEYKPEFRIAVKVDEEWLIYEADTNTKAKKGGDLLDIRDKVLYIGINSETDGKTELGAIKDKDIIDKMVNMVLNGEVNQSLQNHDGQRYFISFHLIDGSDVTKCYWIDACELQRGIILSKEFGIEISRTLENKN